MTTPKQAYIWANARTPDHTALALFDKLLFEAKACAMPSRPLHMYNAAGELGFFDAPSRASEHVRTSVAVSPLAGLVVARPGNAVTHWCDNKGKWFVLNYLGRLGDPQLSKQPCTTEQLHEEHS